MASIREIRLLPAHLSFRVLQKDPATATAEEALQAVQAFFRRRRAGLASVLEMRAEGDHIVLAATGEFPGEVLREAAELLSLGALEEPVGEIEVPAEEFAVEADVQVSDFLDEREVLFSRVRCFPLPECQWFDVTTGDLFLTDRRMIYEPEWVILSEESRGEERPRYVVPLTDVRDVSQGEWWDIPCLMVDTVSTTYRFGWPGVRGAPDSIFDVAEWLEQFRKLLEIET
jgi:hypothetical protein